MGAILTIFQSLGVDQTFFVQLVSVGLVYILLAWFLFPKVQEVLELREKKTSKLESHAHAIYKQAEDLENQYKSHIEKTHQDAHAHQSKQKYEFVKEKKEQIKKREEELQKDYEAQKQILLKELTESKGKVMGEAEGLSKNLVEKLIQ